MERAAEYGILYRIRTKFYIIDCIAYLILDEECIHLNDTVPKFERNILHSTNIDRRDELHFLVLASLT